MRKSLSIAVVSAAALGLLGMNPVLAQEAPPKAKPKAELSKREMHRMQTKKKQESAETGQEPLKDISPNQSQRSVQKQLRTHPKTESTPGSADKTPSPDKTPDR